MLYIAVTMTNRIALITFGLVFFPAACDESAAAPPATLTNLIDAEWTLAPNSEAYMCAYKTVTEDLYVGEFDPVIPLGTHHTVLTMGDPKHADGIAPCSAAVTNPNMIF